MTVQTDIIVPAYREANWKAVGQTPTSDELAEALVLLQNLVDSFFGLVIGTKLRHWHIPTPNANTNRFANYPADPGDNGVPPPNDPLYPPSNSRLLMKVTEEKRVYFQYEPQDGALMEFVDVGCQQTVTLDANGQNFGLTGFTDSVVIVPDYPNARQPRRRWIYRGEEGSWVEIVPLTLTGEMPFPTWFNDFFITELAFRLAPRFGNQVQADTRERNLRMHTFIRGQYFQMGIEIVGEPGGEPSYQTYERGQDFGREAFDQGFPT